RTRPQRVPLPRQPQGEGVCFAGSRLLIDSETPGSAVYSVPVPAPRQASSTPSTPAASPGSRAPSPAATQAAAAAGDAGSTWWPYAVVLFLAGGVAAVVGTVRHRRRHGQLG